MKDINDARQIRVLQLDNLKELELLSSSKGNQRKWYEPESNSYLKEQFYYQGIYWDDWKVEILSNILSKHLETDIQILKQEHVLTSDKTHAVLSKNFCKQDEVFISVYRILKKDYLEFECKGFPMDRFSFLVELFTDVCNLDLSEYLIVMAVLDFILLNEDRHLNNFGVVQNHRGYKLASLFDLGLGLFEHDKRYIGLSFDKAILRVSGKPFCEDMLSILNALNHSKYKEILHRIIKSVNWDSIDEFIPNTLAKQYTTYAESQLKELILC